jgi:hypothetical protein
MGVATGRRCGLSLGAASRNGDGVQPDLGALSPDDVERMLAGLAGEGMAKNSVMRVRSVLLKASKWRIAVARRTQRRGVG